VRRWTTLLLVLSLSGCFTVRHSYEGDHLLTSTPEVEGYKVRHVRHFEGHDRQFFWIHGGFPVGEDLNGAEQAAREIGDHDAVVNLQLTDGQNVTDAFITHIPCILSLLCGTWSVWVEGDVVDLEEAR